MPGVLLIGLGSRDLADARRFSFRTLGEVVGVETTAERQGSDRQVLLVRYVTPQGHEETASLTTPRADMAPGDRIDLLLDPEAPRHIRRDDLGHGILRGLAMIGVGLIYGLGLGYATLRGRAGRRSA